MSKKFGIILLASCLSFSSFAKIRKEKNKVKYRTFFGSCPSRSAGNLTLQLVKTFEKEKSLRELKRKILKEKLDQRHFISDYKIKFNPEKNFLKFSFECPKPLMKVQVYKNNGMDTYDAILVENGELYDPTYEVLLRSEKKLKDDLPYLALPVGNLEKEVQEDITKLVRDMGPEMQKKLSEIILAEDMNLTVILSVNQSPSSIFFGKDKWEEKLSKLKRIIKYMESKKKIPAIVNLTNSKKVVVKFNDKF